MENRSPLAPLVRDDILCDGWSDAPIDVGSRSARARWLWRSPGRGTSGNADRCRRTGTYRAPAFLVGHDSPAVDAEPGVEPDPGAVRDRMRTRLDVQFQGPARAAGQGAHLPERWRRMLARAGVRPEGTS